jgi:hypothetical protein
VGAEFFDGLGNGTARERAASPQLAHAVALDLGGGGDADEFVTALRQGREVEAVSLMLALWSCGRRTSVVQAQRQIHRVLLAACTSLYRIRLEPI